MKHILRFTTVFTLLIFFFGGNVWGQINESFESGLPTSYSTTTTFNLSSGEWTGSSEQVISTTNGVNSESYACQLRSQTGAQITTPTITNGVRNISFYGSSSTSSGSMQVKISSDNGSTWDQIEGSPVSLNETIQLFSFDLFDASINKVQFYRTAATVYIDDVSITGPLAEPSNQPTDFTATASGISAIKLSWTDAVGLDLPDGYLIKASNANNITQPLDGTDPVDDPDLSDGTATIKVNYSGLDSFTFNGLSASTTYYFKIYAYSNAGNMIDFLTTAPQSSNATTANVSLLISEIADPADNYQGRFIELFNSGSELIDFSITNVYLSRQTNGSTWYDFPLTGTVSPNETIIIASYSDFTSIYNFDPDFTIGNFDGNGNDAVFLYLNGDHSSGVLLDIYGVINQDGTGEAWEYEDAKAVRKTSVSAPTNTWNAAEWNIISNCNTTAMTPGMYPVTTWNGSAAKSNGWGTEGNWDNGLPGSGISVFIPSGLSTYPTVSSSSTIEDIVLAEGATLLGQENLTVNGTAYVKKSFTGYSTSEDGWYAVSPPVNGMTIAGSDFEPVETEDDFYLYDEATNYWLNYFDNGNPSTLFDVFDPVTGYLLAYHTNNAGTKSFAGALNATTYSPELSNSNTAWNFVGNPYCSYVTWSDITNTAVSSPKTLNSTTGAWEDIVTTVKAGQGIFVYAESESASLTFELADQTHSSAKKDGKSNGFVKMLAGFGDNLSVQILLQSNENASQDYEWKYDARYFYPVTTIPYLCAITDDDVWVSKYVFNQGVNTTIIPLRFTVAEEQEITFSLADFNTATGITKLTLEDTFLNTFTELSDNQEYIFTASPDDDPMRFKLHAEAETGIHEASEIEGLSIYSYNNGIYLNSDKRREATVEIFNVTGQQAYGRQMTMNGLTRIDPQLSTGWYVVKVWAYDGIATQKVFVK